MTAGAYLAGSAALAAAVAALAWGAWSLRTLLLPEWSGVPARLAEIVVAIAVPTGLAQLLGSFGGFGRFPMLAGCLAFGGVMSLIARKRRVRPGRASGRPAPTASVASRREEVVAAVGATALVATQWTTHVSVALDRGMTQPDTLWYHGSFAARFVQDARLADLPDSTGLSDLATPLHGYITLSGSVYHALGILAFGRDVISPLLNLGWAALALLAAWCIGRRYGVGALCVLGAVVVLGLPTLAGTQPGQAANDVATGALFLAAIALLFEGGLAPRPTAIAAVAAGLAVGVKLSVLVPIAALTVGVVVLALRARRPAVAALWCGVLAVSGGYWFLRNWLVAGSPTPWSDIDLGPISLDAAIESRPNLVGYLDQSSTWRRFILPGFSEAYGRTWPILMTLALGGAALAIIRGRPLERFAGAGVFLVVLYHPFIPFLGDLGGGVFVFTLRYLTPALMLGLALLSIDVVRHLSRWRRPLLIVLVALAALGAIASHHEGIAAWPRGHLLPGVVAGTAVIGGWALVARRPRLGWGRGVAVASAGAAIVTLAAGWVVQDRYLDQRYVRAGLPLDSVNRFFRDIRDEKVAVFGTEHLYPAFGLDLSNRVAKVPAPAGDSDSELCARWRERLSDYAYVVIAHQPLASPGPDEEWVASDAAATVVLVDGNATVYRVDGTLDPDGCA
jgi:hypothetical protein